MANCSYKFSDQVPVHKVTGWFPNAEGLLQQQTKEVKGITPFGLRAGVLTEDKLTDAMCEHLLSKTVNYGGKETSEYGHIIVKKKKVETEAEADADTENKTKKK